MYDPVLSTLLAKFGYALCGGVGAFLAVAMTPTTVRVMCGRTAAGIGVCFLAAEPVRVWIGLNNNVHMVIGINGLVGFMSWYFLHTLDGVATTFGSKKMILTLLSAYIPVLKEVAQKQAADVDTVTKPKLE